MSMKDQSIITIGRLSTYHVYSQIPRPQGVAHEAEKI